MRADADFFQASLDTFSKRAGTYDSESSWVRDISLIEPMLAGIEPHSSVLDVGAGTGAVGELAESKGHIVTSLDSSITMLTYNRVPRKVLGNAQSMPFNSSTFDVVVCRQALHYLKPVEAVMEFARVSRGKVRLGSITMNSKNDIDFWRRYFAIASPGRRHIMAPGDLSRIVNAAGGCVTDTIQRYSEVDLLGAVRHLSESDRRRIVNLFDSSDCSKYYRYTPSTTGGKYMVRWEFVHSEFS